MTQPVNMSVEIPEGLPGQNEQLKASSIIYSKRGSKLRTAYTETKEKYTKMVANELQAQGCIPDKPYDRIKIAFEWFEPNKRRDPDNIRAAAKFIIDGMVWAGMIVNDNLTHVVGLSDEYPDSENGKRHVRVSWTVVS